MSKKIIIIGGRFEKTFEKSNFLIPSDLRSEHQQFQKPVIIHRAILGSVERMIAILTESYGGKWPFWLSPRQAIVIPVAPAHNEYANKVSKRLMENAYV